MPCENRPSNNVFFTDHHRDFCFRNGPAPDAGIPPVEGRHYPGARQGTETIGKYQQQKQTLTRDLVKNPISNSALRRLRENCLEKPRHQLSVSGTDSNNEQRGL